MELRAKRFVMLTRGGVTVLATIVGISALWLVAFAGVARAATCATGPAQLTAVGQSCYTVPAGVSSVRVVAVGAQGGAGDGCGVGGFGAEVDGTLAVTPGGTLYAEVAGHGGPGDDLTGGAAGPNGGGGGGSGGGGGGLTGGGGGGGGATDVRLQPSSVSLGSADSRLLIAGGGGGSGGSNGDCGAGGAGGLFATAGGSTTFASGGRPGIASGGGTFGGSNGSCSSITVATSGALGNGGTGASSPTSNCGGGGGGGAGYFGGGGGGTDGTPGGSGGGAGSSFVNAALVANPSITTAIQATGMVSFIPVFGIVSVSPAGSRSFPGTQPMETLSSPMSVTITDAGSGPLQISSLTFAGTDPQDFLITSNGCIGQLAAGASCTLGVSFAPQAQGARSASLQIASNAQGSPAAVPLSGTGGQLPQGARGATGATGATGNAGKIELVVCTKTTKTTTKNGKKRKITVQHCTTKLVSGTVKFTINSNISAAVSRGSVTYATGLAIPTGTGRWQLILTHRQHSLRPGRYTLTLKSHHGHRRNVKRSVITIT